MLRSVTLGFALSILVAACGLVEQLPLPPPPATLVPQTPPARPFAPGTYVVEAEVRNSSAQPVEFSVFRAVGGRWPIHSGIQVRPLPRDDEIVGAVQPASVPAGASSTKVTFSLPTDGQWVIDVPGWGEIEGKDFDSFLALQCRPLQIYFDADGGWGWPGCTRT